MASKKQCLDINISINDNFLNIKKIDKNSYKELKPTPNKKIGKNLELELIFNKKIGKNSYNELKPTFIKKISKNLNKKLKPRFTHNDIYLRKKVAILITKTNKKVYKQKTYD